MRNSDIRAWRCSAHTGHLDPDSCIVFARRRSQAKKIAYDHGPGFDQVNWMDIRCRRAPEFDGTGGPDCGMYNEDGSWHIQTFRS